MSGRKIDRRTVLKGATALAASAIAPNLLLAQTGFSARPARALPPRGEFVIRGATVLTMDGKLGDFPRGDVHVRNGAIVAVGENVSSAGLTVLDARNMICMPGFVDTHWHCGQSAVDHPDRRPEAQLLPGDQRGGPPLYAGGQLSQRAPGARGRVERRGDHGSQQAHNIRSPEHADAELRAMRDMGVRGRLAYGTPQGGPDDQPMDLAGLAKTQREWMPNDGMLTLGICSRNVGDSTNLLRGNISVETARKDWCGARALGLPITMHTSGPSPVKLLETPASWDRRSARPSAPHQR